MLDSDKTLLEKTELAVEGSEARCGSAHENMAHTNYYIATSRETIRRSQDQIARLAIRLGTSDT